MIREIVEAAQLALHEADVPDLEAPVIVARTLARLDDGTYTPPATHAPRRPEGLRGREEIDFYARQLEHHALADSAWEVCDTVCALVHRLFGAIGERATWPTLGMLPPEATADELLDEFMPPPRVVARELAPLVVRGASVEALRALLDAPQPEHRVLGLRAVPDEALAQLADLLVELLLRDPEHAVRDEARSALHMRPAEQLAEVRHLLAVEIEHATGADRGAVLAEFHHVGGALERDQLFSYLADPASEVRHAALGWVGSVDVGDRQPELIEALRQLLADDGTRWQALIELAKFYEAARPAAVDVARCLPDPDCVARVRIVLRRCKPLPPEALDVLRGFARGASSTVATDALQLLADVAPRERVEVSVEYRVARALQELGSLDEHVVHSGINGAASLPPADAGALIVKLREIGERRVAAGVDRTDPMLTHVRRALGRLGIRHEAQPRPFSWMEAYRGITPAEWLDCQTCMVGTIRDTVTTPTEERLVEALGVWDWKTGQPWLVVENADCLRVLDGGREALVLRRDGNVWHFEHYALPSGERTRVLHIPPAATEYKRARGIEAITVEGDLATIDCEHHSPGRLNDDSGIVIQLDPAGDRFVRAL